MKTKTAVVLCFVCSCPLLFLLSSGLHWELSVSMPVKLFMLCASRCPTAASRYATPACRYPTPRISNSEYPRNLHRWLNPLPRTQCIASPLRTLPSAGFVVPELCQLALPDRNTGLVVSAIANPASILVSRSHLLQRSKPATR